MTKEHQKFARKIYHKDLKEGENVSMSALVELAEPLRPFVISVSKEESTLRLNVFASASLIITPEMWKKIETVIPNGVHIVDELPESPAATRG